MRLFDWTRTLGWMIRDTFRQSLASGLCWLLVAVSSVCILVCLSTSAKGPVTLAPGNDRTDFVPRFDVDAKDAGKLERSGVAVADGALTLAFGTIRVPMARDVQSAVHFLQLILAAGVADTLGLLLTLVWTAGFLPGFFDPRAVSVLLAKPAPRWGLLLGKYVGVLAFVLVQAAYFVVGTWLALGLRTGVWDSRYLLCVPLLLLHFAIFFSFSLLLAVCTRSTVVCVFGSIAFWGVCWGLNYGRHALVALQDVASLGNFSHALVRVTDWCYWLLPKPIDLGSLVFNALGADTHFRPAFENLASVSLGLSIATSLAFALYMLVAAGRQWARMDY